MQALCGCGRTGRKYWPDIVFFRRGAFRNIVQTVHFPSFWHSHRTSYAAIILAGGYEEAGDQGLFRAKVGDVLFQERFKSHKNTLSAGGELHATVN
jgi:hypothetical protein